MVTERRSLHEQLQHYRAEYGLSFQQLSARSYVDVAYLHRLETGRAARPSRDILLRIAIGLGLDVERTDDLLATAGHLPLIRPRLLETNATSHQADS